MLRPEIGEGCGGAVRVAVGDAAHASCSAAARASRTASAPAEYARTVAAAVV